MQTCGMMVVFMCVAAPHMHTRQVIAVTRQPWLSWPKATHPVSKEALVKAGSVTKKTIN